jgi:hypothetical protein
MQITLRPHVEVRLKDFAKGVDRKPTAVVNRILEATLWGPDAHSEKGTLALALSSKQIHPADSKT